MNAKSRGLLALVAALASPAAAQSGVASVTGTTVSFNANVGEGNHLIVVWAREAVRMVDTGASITPGPGCAAVASAEVVCPIPGRGPLALEVVLSDMDDFVTVGGGDFVSSRLKGGAGNDTIEGSDGTDRLLGEEGTDLLKGGTDNDIVDGGPGADILEGGIGNDTAIYADRVNPVTVTIDGVANDGENAEGDDVRDSIETIRGGLAGDTLVGGTSFGSIYGGPGDDILRAVGGVTSFTFLSGEAGDDRLTASQFGSDVDGGAGRDTLIGGNTYDLLNGGPGPDSLRGGRGHDEIFGGEGADLLRGGRGQDDIYGGSGRDLLFGGAGRDFLHARDRRRDRIDGGPSRDRATVDRRDTIRRVEVVRRPS